MRILYIIPAFQHPTVRGPHRHYHFLRQLAPRHAITLLTLKRSDVAPEAIQEVAALTEKLMIFDATRSAGNSLAAALGMVPGMGRRLEQWLLARQAVARLRRSVAQLVEWEQFDVVLFHGKPIWSVTAACAALPMAVDFCDATSMRILATAEHAPLWRRPWLRHRYRQMRRIERRVLRHTPHQAFISDRDRRAVLGDDEQALVLPNGVDLEYWTPRRRAPRPGSLIFTGVMDYGPNDDAGQVLLDDVFPRVQAQVPDARLCIAGRNPTERLRAKAASLPGVTVTGFVADLREHLEQAAVFVNPLRYGAGMQNKVLEAMAMELPVVTSSLSSEGLCLEGEQPPLVVADEPRQFAARVVALLADAAEQRRLGQSGRQYIERHFSWARSGEKLEQLCLAAAGQRACPAPIPS